MDMTGSRAPTGTGGRSDPHREHDPVERTTVAVDVADAAPDRDGHVVVDVFVPPAGADTPRTLWWLLPGGGMSRRYWDLDTPDGVGGYSCARHLASRGDLVVAADHLGAGDSTRPTDGYTLTSAVLADVNAHAFGDVLGRIRAGTLVEELPALPDIVPIGCGHSMGASLTVFQQARHHSYRALCLLGYGGRGLPARLDPELACYAEDPTSLHRDLVGIARSRYGDDPLPVLPPAGRAAGGSTPRTVHDALRAASTNLLAVAGLQTLVPGNAAPQIAGITVPVFLAHGDRDIGAPLHEAGSEFTASDDVTLFRLRDAGHNHNVSANRQRLWDRMLDWAGPLA